MDVKEAVATAKSYVADLFAEENFSDLGLEEVSLDQQADQWVVTLGFARPWERAATGFLASQAQNREDRIRLSASPTKRERLFL
jgi:hypothetical protein